MERTKNRLELIKRGSLDVKARIDKILENDNKIGLATTPTEPYAQDLYKLMKDMAETANPILMEMGLDKSTIDHDIDEYVGILGDNEHVMYFASVNLEAKYSKNKIALTNISKWLDRLVKSIEKIEAFLETETESKELKKLHAMLDKTKLAKQEKEKLKAEFTRVLNKLNS